MIKPYVFLRQLVSSHKACKDLRIIGREFCFSKQKFVHEISKTVKSYGKLVIDLPWNVEVKSTDPHEYPDMDTLIVQMLSSTSNDLDIENILLVDLNKDICRITQKSNNKIELSKETKFIVQAPIQYDIDARTSGNSSLSISNMVSDLINAQTQKGNIRGTKLQSKKMMFNSNDGGGIVLAKSLQGDIEIKTVENGTIEAEKCLGTNLEITTENGDVNLGSNYCERAIFKTVNGNLYLNNLHMDASVEISGNGSLNVSCLDGSLQARLKNGDAKIHVVRLTGKSHIISKGPIDLIVPEENNMQLSLKSNKLSLHENAIGKNVRLREEGVFETNGEIPLSAETGESLRVSVSSWAESLKLGKFVK